MAEREYWDLLIKKSVGRLLVMAALLERPGHGYEVAKRLKAIYPGCCEPSDAMIYPMLRQLDEGGYVACDARATGGGRVQKVCTLTARGRDALREAVAAWKAVLPGLQETIATAERALEQEPQEAGHQARCCSR